MEVGKLLTITVIQKRPNTCVAISTVDETQYVGFSKVCWPDTWDARTGLHVALGKAAADMFEIKVPKSGRMDVHLLSDPCPGVRTKGERELEELLDQWNGPAPSEAAPPPGKGHAMCPDDTPEAFEEAAARARRAYSESPEALRASWKAFEAGAKAFHIPDHRTMEEKQDDKRHKDLEDATKRAVDEINKFVAAWHKNLKRAVGVDAINEMIAALQPWKAAEASDLAE